MRMSGAFEAGLSINLPNLKILIKSLKQQQESPKVNFKSKLNLA